MRVRVVHIRNMAVGMAQRLMSMPVTVFAGRHRLVRMVVMVIVVSMRMLVLERFVLVFVTVRFRQMQNHTGEHQYASQPHQPADRTIAERHGERGADERCEREHRPRARRAERALCKQIEAQAQAIAARTDGKQRQHRTGRWQGFGERGRE